MTETESQNPVRLEDSIAETKLVAMIRQEPTAIEATNKLEFRPSFDDLDYLVFATLSLPSGDRIGLIRHDNSPAPGTEICVKHDQQDISTVLQQALVEMNLTSKDLTWIHPEYEAIILNPQFSPSYHRLSEVLSKQGKHQEAIKFLQEGIRQNPQNPESYYLLAQQWENLQNWENAVKTYSQVLKLEPHFPEASQKLNHALAEKLKLNRQSQSKSQSTN